MNAEHEHLASAYLDGELTDEERRVAEADPAVMAEVASLRAIRARIADVEPPAPAAREAAISAAMATFRELHPTETGAASARASHRDAPIAMRRRYERVRWLGAAAAVVIVGALGVAVVRGVGGGDDDQSADEFVAEDHADTDVAAEVPVVSSTSASRLTEEAAADAASDDAASAEATSDAATSDDAEASIAASGAAEMAPEAAAEEPASAGDSAMAPPLADPSVHFDDGVPIESPLQLRSAAQYLVDQRDLGELGPTPEYSCPYYDVLGVAEYDDGGRLHEVLIDVDESSDLVTAVDRDTCEPLAAIELAATP